MYQKNKKHRSEENLSLIRSLPCSVCGKWPPSDPCHVRSRGAGGSDELWNLFPACRACHQKQHKTGIVTFYRKYNSFRSYLQSLGWSEDHRGKLVRNEIK